MKRWTALLLERRRTGESWDQEYTVFLVAFACSDELLGWIRDEAQRAHFNALGLGE